MFGSAARCTDAPPSCGAATRSRYPGLCSAERATGRGPSPIAARHGGVPQWIVLTAAPVAALFAVALATLLVPLGVGSTAAAPPGSRPAVAVSAGTPSGASVTITCRSQPGHQQSRVLLLCHRHRRGGPVWSHTRLRREEGEPLHHRPVEPERRRPHHHRHRPAEGRWKRQRSGHVHDRRSAFDPAGRQDRGRRAADQPLHVPGHRRAGQRRHHEDDAGRQWRSRMGEPEGRRLHALRTEHAVRGAFVPRGCPVQQPPAGRRGRPREGLRACHADRRPDALVLHQ